MSFLKDCFNELVYQGLMYYSQYTNLTCLSKEDPINLRISISLALEKLLANFVEQLIM